MSDSAPEHNDKDVEEPKHWSDWLSTKPGRAVRYGLALLIVVAAAAFSLSGRFEVCEVVDSAADGRTTTCAPPDLNQASVLAVTALVLALLWPDIQEFSAFGVSIKKLVKEVGERVRRVGDTAGRVDATTNRIAATTEATHSGVTQLQSTLGTQSDRLAELLDGVRDLTSRAAHTPEQPSSRWSDADTARLRDVVDRWLGPDRAAPDRDTSREMLIGELLELWRRLGGRHGTGVARTIDQREQPISLVRIESLLEVLARVIQALARGDEVPNEALRDAVGLARWLLYW